jgi:hypothetical protein
MAGPRQKERFFLEIRKSRGANLQVCGRQHVLGLATMPPRCPVARCEAFRPPFPAGKRGGGGRSWKYREIYGAMGEGQWSGEARGERHAQLWGLGLQQCCCRTWVARRAGGKIRVHSDGGAGAVGLTCVEYAVMVGVCCDLKALM